MTDRELMQQALDALMAADPDDMVFDAEGHMVFRKDVAITALRNRLAQPEQEPVAWRYRGNLHEFDPSDWAEGPVTPLYKAPPAAQLFWDLFDENQRLRAELKFNTTPPQQWVGLTDEDKAEIFSRKWWNFEDEFDLAGFLGLVEAKLKEKNGG